jgi:hypothetical protein
MFRDITRRRNIRYAVIEIEEEEEEIEKEEE